MFDGRFLGMVERMDPQWIAWLYQKRLFYVGASRARNRLFITSVVSEEEEKQMVRAITNGSYEKRMRLASYLKITLR